MATEVDKVQSQVMQAINKSSNLAIVVGIVLILMGFLAMGAPLLAGLTVAMMVGLLLAVCGIAQIVFSLKVDKRAFTFFFGFLNLLIGAYMVMNAGVALASLTTVLTIYLIFSGASEAYIAFKMKPLDGWGWMLFSGIISVVLGVMIWRQFPVSGVWAVGILVGARMFFSGWTLLMLGITGKGAKRTLASSKA